MRPVRFQRGFTQNPAGSVLVEFGNTVVFCTVSVEDSVPPWMMNSGRGWLSAEYSMLPGSSHQRKQRTSRRGGVDGRSLEIGRLVGRSLRAVTNLKVVGQRTFWVDCDVIQADGGTRTAAITGGYVALHDAFTFCKKNGKLGDAWPLSSSVAAVSVGLVNGKPCLDLDYNLDSRAEVDMNIVMTGGGEFVEIQGTAERGTFGQSHLDEFLRLGRKGIEELTRLQRAALGIEEE